MSRHGIGLRTAHFAQLLENGLRQGWVEAISENFMGRGGRPLAVLERVRRDVPVALHGVSLGIGGLEPLDLPYLQSLRALAERVEAWQVSDHLCFGGYGGHRAHDLWPLPFTEEALEHVVSRVAEVQEALGRRIALENVSSYVEYTASELTEWEFTAEVARRAGCDLLLDVNNLYVNAQNHGYDPLGALERVPAERVAYLHLAGHERQDGYLFDTHGGEVSDPVWGLYAAFVRRHGPKPTLIEWDQAVPPLERVLQESNRAATIEAAALSGVAA